MDRIEAPAEQSGLRSVDVERNTKREHLSSTDQARRLDDVLRGHMIERADLVVFSPPAPVFQLLRCFGDCLSTDLDVHFRPQVSCCPAAVRGPPLWVHIKCDTNALRRAKLISGRR